MYNFPLNILGLKDEMLNNSQNISFDEHPLFLDLDNSFLGFDSVIISKSVLNLLFNINYYFLLLFQHIFFFLGNTNRSSM